MSFSYSVQFSSVTQSCLTLCDPMNCSIPGFPVHHQLPEPTQLMSIESVMPSNHLILCRPFSSQLQSFPASGSICALLTMPKPLTVWITINCGKF